MTGVDLLSDGASPKFIEFFYCGLRKNTRNIFKNDYAKRIFATTSRFFVTEKKPRGGPFDPPPLGTSRVNP